MDQDTPCVQSPEPLNYTPADEGAVSIPQTSCESNDEYRNGEYYQKHQQQGWSPDQKSRMLEKPYVQTENRNQEIANRQRQETADAAYNSTVWGKISNTASSVWHHFAD
jgi:hypothetical protein